MQRFSFLEDVKEFRLSSDRTEFTETKVPNMEHVASADLTTLLWRRRRRRFYFCLDQTHQLRELSPSSQTRLVPVYTVNFGRSGLSTWKYQFSYDH